MLWTVAVGQGFGGGAIKDNKVYFLDRIVGEKDVLRCLDLLSGEEIWQFSNQVAGRLPYPGSRSVPTVTNDQIYAISGMGIVYCLDIKTRKLEWSIDLKENYKTEPPRFGYAQSPLVYKNVLILAPMGKEAGLVALDRITGEEKWKTPGLGHGFSTPTLRNLIGMDQVIFHTTINRDQKEGIVTSVDPNTGKILWEFKDFYVMAPIPGQTVINENTLFLTGGYEAGSVMLDITKKGNQFQITEKFRLGKGSQIHLPILFEDHLYLIVNENANLRAKSRHKEGGLMCVDLNGNTKWRTGESPNMGRGNMIFADGMLIIQDGRNGVLRLVEPNAKEFKLLAEANIFEIGDDKEHQMWAPMALSNGKLVLRSQDEMKCVELKP